MKPVRLDVCDFLSYVDPEPLDLGPIDVACLTGPNGVGKSALLDAMTWALFGAARGCEGGRNQDRIIRTGADTARVALEFDLSGDRYRVIRTRRLGKATSLAVEVATDSEWTSLAGESLRETEAALNDLLRMDYKTFTASAFFVQGRADEFLQMKPEDRKEVFSRLLGLEIYERLAEAARAKARAAGERRAVSEQRITELRARAEDVGACQEALEASQKAVAGAHGAVDEASSAVDEASSAVADLEKVEVKAAAMEGTQAVLEARLSEQRNRLADLEQEQERLQSLLATEEDVRRRSTELSELRGIDADFTTRQQTASDLQVRRTELESSIASEAGTLTDRLQRLRQECEEASNLEVEREGAQRELDGARQTQAALSQAASELERAQQTKADGARQAAALAVRLEGMRAELREVDERRELLARADASCPVCGGALDDSHRESIGAEVEATRTKLNEALRECEKEDASVADENDRVAAEILRLTSQSQKLTELERQVEVLIDRIQRLGDPASRVRTLTASANDIEASLQREEFAQTEREALSRVVAELNQTYDAAEHAKVKEKLETVASASEDLARIEMARERSQAIVTDVAEVTAAFDGATTEIDSLRGVLEAARTTLRELPGARERLASAEASRRDAEAALGEALEAERVARSALEEAQRIHADIDRESEVMRASVDTERVHRRLATSFGRRGIPARVIDNAIPELREETNAVLGRLTEGQMYVDFPLQREKRSGGVTETFDVLVHHDGDVRDYAMFSGGEAFRLAFAVRIGLSKLLVRRAGARVELLVIDEGFGTQDPAGRERILEAITIARQEFSTVLVISHLDELKDAFGTQIAVWRDGNGSQYRVADARRI